MSQRIDTLRLKVAKYLLFAVNIILFLVGCVLLGIGIQSKIGEQEYIVLTDEVSQLSGYFVATNFCIMIGVVIVLVGFFGCCGAVAEKTIVLLIFFILLAIVFTLELAVCIYGYAKRDDLKNQFELAYKDVIKTRYTNETRNNIRYSIDKFQQDFYCCGYNGVEDWKESNYVLETNKFPSSCCRIIVNCTNSVNEFKKENFHEEGCFENVVEWFTNNLSMIATSSLAFGVFQIFGLAFSMTLYCMLKNVRAT